MFPRIYSLFLVHLIGSVAVAGQLAFAPDGRSLIVANPDGNLRIHDPLTALFNVTTLRAHAGAVLDLAVSPDGRQVFSAGADGCVRVWDRATWKEVATFSGHTGPVFSIAISREREWVWAGISRLFAITSMRKELSRPTHRSAR